MSIITFIFFLLDLVRRNPSLFENKHFLDPILWIGLGLLILFYLSSSNLMILCAINKGIFYSTGIKGVQVHPWRGEKNSKEEELLYLDIVRHVWGEHVFQVVDTSLNLLYSLGGTEKRKETTRSHSDLDMWNRLAPYVLRLFGRHGQSSD